MISAILYRLCRRSKCIVRFRVYE